MPFGRNLIWEGIKPFDLAQEKEGGGEVSR